MTSCRWTWPEEDTQVAQVTSRDELIVFTEVELVTDGLSTTSQCFDSN